MARISGVELNDNWKVDFALTRIKGLGWPLSKNSLGSLKLTPKRVKELKDEIAKINGKLDDMTVEENSLGW